jgi:hypothetical protein
LPEGYLAFAAPDRLAVSIPAFASFPLDTSLQTANGTYTDARSSLGGGFHVVIYAMNGRAVASLGSTDEQPYISAMRRIAVRYSPQTETQTMSVQGLPNGSPRGVIGFDAGRTLIAFAWRWPSLALIDTASAALPDGQFSCQYGTYAPPSPPLLTVFDLAQPGTFVPAPIAPPQPTSQQVFATCGPPPP